MEVFQEAIAQFQGAEAGGFNFSLTQTASLLNEGMKRFAARSEWLKSEKALGSTVNGQEIYGTLDDRLVRLKALTVEDIPYSAKDLITLWRLKTAQLELQLPYGIGGIFVERFSDDGYPLLNERRFSLWPIPTVDGLPILGLAIMTPPNYDPTIDAMRPLPFPVEYNRGILDYAKGIAYEDVDENSQSGTYYMTRGDAKADELRLRSQSHIGKGPYKIPVTGHRR